MCDSKLDSVQDLMCESPWDFYVGFHIKFLRNFDKGYPVRFPKMPDFHPRFAQCRISCQILTCGFSMGDYGRFGCRISFTSEFIWDVRDLRLWDKK